MDFTGVINILAILLECLVAVIAVLIAARNKMAYGWLIAIAFALFALFEGDRIFYPYGLPRLNSLILLAACASMLYAIWLLYNDTGKNRR